MKQHCDDRMPKPEATQEEGCWEYPANTTGAYGAGGPRPCSEKPALRRCTLPTKGEGHCACWKLHLQRAVPLF